MAGSVSLQAPVTGNETFTERFEVMGGTVPHGNALEDEHDKLRDWLDQKPGDYGGRQGYIHIQSLWVFHGVTCIVIGLLNFMTSGGFLFAEGGTQGNASVQLASEMLSLCMVAVGGGSLMAHMYLRPLDEGKFVIGKAYAGWHIVSVLCIARRVYLEDVIPGPFNAQLSSGYFDGPRYYKYNAALMMAGHAAYGLWFFIWLAGMRHKQNAARE